MEGLMALKCCFLGCDNDGVLHLAVGAVESTVAEDADYCGASYCSYEHLDRDSVNLRSQFTNLVPLMAPTAGRVESESEGSES